MKRQWADEFTLLCEKCGYVIEGLDRTGRCPECGEAIAASLPERRTAVPGVWETVRRPRASLRAMRIDEFARKRVDARACEAGFAALIASVLVVAGFWGMFSAEVHVTLWLALATVPLAGFLAAIGATGLSWVEAAGLRVIGARHGYRMTRVIAGSIVSAGAVGWIASGIGGGMAFGALVADLSLTFPPPPNAELPAVRLRTPEHFVHISMWCVALPGVMLCIGGFLFFEVFAYLGLRELRYANRARPGEPSV